MRIAVSDYDGTIANRQGLLGDVVPAIKRWRGEGNVFGIATGRDLPMTLTETVKWGIEYDFLVCINGAALYDENNALLEAKLLPNDLPERLMRHPAGMASFHYQLSGLEGLRVLAREGSWFPKLGIPYQAVSFDQAVATKDLGQISFAYASAEECAKWHDMLVEDFGGAIAAHPNKTTIDINVAGVDKAAGIEEIVRRRGWGGSEVLTIGDGGNDVGMIEKFGGFTVPGAEPFIEKLATRVFANVPEMLAEA